MLESPDREIASTNQMNNPHSPEDTFIRQTEQQKMMSHDAASLLLFRTFKKLVANMEELTKSLHSAAEQDFDEFCSTAAVAPRVGRVIGGVTDLLGEVTVDLSQIQAYWDTLPWSSDIPYNDPRGKTVPGAPQKSPASALSGAGNPPPPQEAHASPPGPDFDPDLLASKRVTSIDCKNDVRNRKTLGDPIVEVFVGGPPAFWLKSADGTRVVLLQEDLPKVISALQRLTGNEAQG